MTTISVTIITKNEAANISACIESVLWADEIIVLDAGSTDTTPTICQKFAPKVKLHVTDWPGFGMQKNRALLTATQEWVLSIDADERVPEELRGEIIAACNSNANTAYRIPRLNYFLGKPLQFGFGKDAPIRLVKKDCGKFTNDHIHEQMVVTGSTGTLKNKLLHFSVENISDITTKISNYSTLGADKLYQQNQSSSFFKAISHAYWIFFKIYLLRGGFLGGWRGFLWAFANFEGTIYRYLKLLEKNQFRTKHSLKS